jgi:hypothetical protein
MEQMMERLLAKMDANQAQMKVNQTKTDSNLREMREEMKVGQEFLKEGMLTKLDTHHERMMAGMDSQLEKMEACLGKTEATDETEY